MNREDFRRRHTRKCSSDSQQDDLRGAGFRERSSIKAPACCAYLRLSRPTWSSGTRLTCSCRQCSPGLWKELAKEVLGSKALLEGFLEPASTLALISDHRTQELVFEALYRLWKVSG